MVGASKLLWVIFWLTCLSSGRFTPSALAWSKPSCSTHRVLGCVTCWTVLTFSCLGSPSHLGNAFQQSHCPQRGCCRGALPLQAEQSTRADGDEDLVQICSVQEHSERALKQLESSQLHWIPSSALFYLFCSTREVFSWASVLLESWVPLTLGVTDVLVTFSQLLGTTLSD